MTINEVRKELNSMGELLLLVKDIKNQEDLNREEGKISLLLKGLLCYGCKDLILKIKSHFLSIGISEEEVNEYCCGYMEEQFIDQAVNTLKETGFIE